MIFIVSSTRQWERNRKQNKKMRRNENMLFFVSVKLSVFAFMDCQKSNYGRWQCCEWLREYILFLFSFFFLFFFVLFILCPLYLSTHSFSLSSGKHFAFIMIQALNNLLTFPYLPTTLDEHVHICLYTHPKGNTLHKQYVFWHTQNENPKQKMNQKYI